MEAALLDAFEGAKGTWIKWPDEDVGKVVMGLVTAFDVAGDTVMNGTDKQPRIQIMLDTGELSYVSMTTVLRNRLKDLAPKIMPFFTIVRIEFVELQDAKNPAFSKTKIIDPKILNPDNKNDDPAKKAAMDDAYRQIMSQNPMWDEATI